MIYVVCAIVFNAVVIATHGKGAVIVLILLFFFEAPMYPTLFTLGTENLGRHTRRGVGILVMGVSGGALFPPIQGTIADSAGTRICYIVSLVGFAYVLGYTAIHRLRQGCDIVRIKDHAVGAEGVLGGVVESTHYDGDKVDVTKVERQSFRSESKAFAS